MVAVGALIGIDDVFRDNRLNLRYVLYDLPPTAHRLSETGIAQRAFRQAVFDGSIDMNRYRTGNSRMTFSPAGFFASLRSGRLAVWRLHA
jgi:hypothetical protein